MRPFQDHREDEVMPPPEEGAEGEFFGVREILWKVEVSIRKIEEMFPFYELTGQCIDPLGREEIGRRQLFFERGVETLQYLPHLPADDRLGREEIGVLDQP